MGSIDLLKNTTKSKIQKFVDQDLVVPINLLVICLQNTFLFVFFRNDLAPDEYESMKEDTVDQIKDFTVTLDRMNKGDITLNNKFSTMRAVNMNDTLQFRISSKIL